MKYFLIVISMLVTTTSPLFAEALDSSDSTTPKTSRIVGGVKSPFGAWPATVALLDVSKINAVEAGTALDNDDEIIPIYQANFYAQFCGASLIAPNWVLTAAHCVVNSSTGVPSTPASIDALVGTSNLLSGGSKITVKRIIVHPSYSYITDDADVALLELDYFTSVPTLSISGDTVPDNLLATVVGWGALDEGETFFPASLYEVEVPTVNQSTCENSYGSTDITQNMLCAGYHQGGKDSCKSDSGGPLMGVQNGEYVQIGITSWGAGCAQAELYGVYTRVSRFENWINFYTGNSSNQGGGIDSWSHFYFPAKVGGGSIFFLLFLLPLVLLRQLSYKFFKSQRGVK